MPSTKKLEISHVEGKEEFEIGAKLMGQELLDQMCEKLQMDICPLFSFGYTDAKGHGAFVKLEKKVLSQDLSKKEDPKLLDFRAKYFPESVADELTHPTVQRLFWRQIKQGIVEDTIYCPPELCVLFAAQTQQFEQGDCSAEMTLDVSQALPQRVLGQHSLTPPEWQEVVKSAWSKLKGTPKQAALMDYLNIAQDLEQYGITYFEVTNKKKTNLWLGVHNLGMDVYEYSNKVTPRLGFPWSEIRNISFNDKKFTIKMVSKEAPDFKFFSPRYKLNKRILQLCVGNHQFFVTRRQAQAAGKFSEGEDRATLESKLRNTKDQLLSIRQNLDSKKDSTKQTAEDLEYRKNQEAGNDKFKTMKKAQSGDAKRRVLEFEDLDAVC